MMSSGVDVRLDTGGFFSPAPFFATIAANVDRLPLRISSQHAQRIRARRPSVSIMVN